jgi:pantoate--beta-alanine ligase
MLIITDPAELAPYVGCAFVPTMGALHDGHLSLVKESKKSGNPVVVSIFVNPTQFAPDEDYDKYPRDLEQDAAFAEDVGADVVFAPSVETMYPSMPPPEITIPTAALDPKLEDACRPLHFQGVCVAVARLFDLVRPSLTVFGLKDYQQYLVIKQLIEQKPSRWNGLQIVGAEIIRDNDNLAMSSRNIYLSTDQRSQALGLHEAIACDSETEMQKVMDDHGLEIEYAVIRDAETLLEPIDGRPARALVAARIGDIRLIDNAEVPST